MTKQATILIDNEGRKNKIRLLKPLRVLRGKRVVFVASWQEETVLVKLFSKEKYWSRELTGLGFLSRFKLASPQCLYSGQVAESSNLQQFGMKPKKQMYVLVLEFYKNALDFRTQWRSESLHESKRKELFSKLLILLAQHHQSGVIQSDLHLGNFLIVNNDLVTIDGDAVEHHCSLSIKECYRQLGILLAQSFPKYDAMLEALLPRYFNERKLEYNRLIIKEILNSREIARKIAKKNWVNKVYRESSQFKIFKTFSYYICISRAFDNIEFHNRAFNLINDTKNIVEWNDGKYQYKATRYVNTLYSGGRCLKENEASIHWLNAQLKLFFGENSVAIPVALVLNTLGPFHKSGFFVQAKMR